MALGLDENTLKISWYNESSKSWEILSKNSPKWVHATGVATADIPGFAGYVWANISHLSTFGLVGSYPVSSPPSYSGGGSSSGTGGGGGGASGENYTNIEVSEKYDIPIYKDKVSSYKFTNVKNPIMYVNITGNVSTEVMTALIESLKGTSTLVNSPAPGIVYKNTNIWVGTKGFAIPRNIKQGVITFRVETSWIQSNNLAAIDVKLLRWDEAQWVTLETIKKSEDSTYTYFESMSNTFSPFAITGLKAEASTPIQTKAALPTSIPAGTSDIPIETKSTTNWVLIIGVIFVIGIAIVLYVMNKGKSK